MMTPQEICQHCGACCATFRVSFYWSEADPSAGGNVPADLTDSLYPYRCCMKTDGPASHRCVALDGKIGSEVHCHIYSNRPSPCRDFGFDESGRVVQEDINRCNSARERFGLPPLNIHPN
jgi:Fe-S-cluster containining protein